MKLAVTGSRCITQSLALIEKLNELQPDEIITGGAAGADRIAQDWAIANGKKLTILKPDYACFGKTASMVRNAEIVRLADKVIAVWDGKSKGTEATAKMAKRGG